MDLFYIDEVERNVGRGLFLNGRYKVVTPLGIGYRDGFEKDVKTSAC